MLYCIFFSTASLLVRSSVLVLMWCFSLFYLAYLVEGDCLLLCWEQDGRKEMLLILLLF